MKRVMADQVNVTVTMGGHVLVNRDVDSIECEETAGGALTLTASFRPDPQPGIAGNTGDPLPTPSVEDWHGKAGPEVPIEEPRPKTRRKPHA